MTSADGAKPQGGLSFGLGKTAGKKRSVASAFGDSDDDEPSTSGRPGAEELQGLGDAAAAAGRWGEALRHWNEALAAAAPGSPVLAVLHEQKAQVYLELNQEWRAIQSAAKAVELRPGWAAAHLTLGRAQLAYGEPELAQASLERAVKLAPEDTAATEELSTVRVLVLRRAGGGGQRLQVRGAAPPVAGGRVGGGLAGGSKLEHNQPSQPGKG